MFGLVILLVFSVAAQAPVDGCAPLGGACNSSGQCCDGHFFTLCDTTPQVDQCKTCPGTGIPCQVNAQCCDTSLTDRSYCEPSQGLTGLCIGCSGPNDGCIRNESCCGEEGLWCNNSVCTSFTLAPTEAPTDTTNQPTEQPTAQPTGQPTAQPTGQPTTQPTTQPTNLPTAQPTTATEAPTPPSEPTEIPTLPVPTSDPGSTPQEKGIFLGLPFALVGIVLLGVIILCVFFVYYRRNRRY